MPMNRAVLIVLIIANLPLYWFLGKILFKDWQGLIGCLKYWLRPDIISWFRGEWSEDFWAEMRLFFYIIGCVACVFAEYKIIEKLFLSE